MDMLSANFFTQVKQVVSSPPNSDLIDVPTRKPAGVDLSFFFSPPFFFPVFVFFFSRRVARLLFKAAIKRDAHNQAHTQKIILEGPKIAVTHAVRNFNRAWWLLFGQDFVHDPCVWWAFLILGEVGSSLAKQFSESLPVV